MSFLLIVGSILLLVIWLSFLLPQYAAWKNRRYKAMAISLSAFALGFATFWAMFIYGDFITLLGNEVIDTEAMQQDDFWLCSLGFVCVVSHFFCWWYIYGRKSLDFFYVMRTTAE